MGVFQVKLTVSNFVDAARQQEVELWVDTGSAYSWISRQRLEALGARPIRRMQFRTIEGRLVERDLAAVLVAAVELKRAVAGLGTISGERRAPVGRTPYRRWRVHAIAQLELALHLLWPFLGRVKRDQARDVMKVFHGQPDLARGNPAFGAAGSRYCYRGHDKLSARLRPFKGRGRNVDDPRNDLRQCLVCVRLDARERRRRALDRDALTAD